LASGHGWYDGKLISVKQNTAIGLLFYIYYFILFLLIIIGVILPDLILILFDRFSAVCSAFYSNALNALGICFDPLYVDVFFIF
jgi:hypothetical protein